MTEQDAADADAGDATAPEADGTEADAGDTAAEDLEDIAAEPAGDADDALAEVLDEVDPDEELVERVAEADPEETAREIAALRQRVDALESQLATREEEVDDLESRLKRKQADFQNYKKRQKRRMEEEKQRATEDLVERLLDVRDSLTRALDQDEDVDIRDGVESTLRQFDHQLERENVEPIEPEPGDDLDPQRHEALATVPAAQPEDTIAQVHRAGYEMADKVLRPAQVAVSDGSKAGDEENESEPDDEGEGGETDADETGSA